jgi:hypothetical protein
VDLPFVGSIMERLDCDPQIAPGRSFCVAHFNPAHQVIELEVYKNEKAEPYRTRLVLGGIVKRFD